MNLSRTSVMASVLTLGLIGCEVPTALPIIEQQWVLPVKKITLGADEMLPNGVTVVGSGFDISMDPVSTGESLGSLCPACVLIDGLGPLPLPAFSGSFTSSQALPTDVVSAEITGGVVSLLIDNGLSFDPLAGGGTVLIEVRNGAGGALLGSLMLAGAGDALPAGSTVTVGLSLVAGTLDTSLFMSVSLGVAGGQMAVVDVTQRIDVVATINSVLVRAITADVLSRTVDIGAGSVDLEDIDTDISDRIVEGAIILDVENPFDVSFTGTIEIGGTSKPFSLLGAGPSEVTLQYTGDEIRSFVGQPGVSFSGSGTAVGSAVAITPGQEMTIEVTLDLTIEIG